ncbi:MAG: MmgE/PrpD family protein [Thermoleophilia bacterium]|nr:MmgE/PrpD family protein [Thermoleophilia bacterium]
MGGARGSCKRLDYLDDVQHRAQRRCRACRGTGPRLAARERTTVVARLAGFVVASSYDDLAEEARHELKIRVLDALGCAFGALGTPAVRAIRAQLDDFGGRPLCTLIGGGRTAPDRAALHNGTLVRYLDFNDSYFAPGETCHPSDNLAPVLATVTAWCATSSAANPVSCSPEAGEGQTHATGSTSEPANRKGQRGGQRPLRSLRRPRGGLSDVVRPRRGSEDRALLRWSDDSDP